MIDKVKEWVFEGEMDGFDTLAAEEIGFDYMELLKGGAGMLSGAGGLLSGGGGAKPDAAAQAAQAAAAAAKAQAEASARTWKIIGGIALGVLGLGGIALLARKAA